MKRKVCVFTGTRAEYGILHWLMKGIQNELDLELQLIVSGTHLSPEFGLTYKEIEKDGFTIDKKVEMILSADTPSAISKSTGLGMIGFADAYNDLKPDVVVLLGDRYELIAASLSALYCSIPIAHIAGGESTIGAFDEAIRHSITKMAWWHFTSTEVYKNRVIQMGENPKRVYAVGALNIDNVVKTPLLNKSELEKKIGFKFGKRNLLVTFHPVTMENNTAEKHFIELLNALKTLNHTRFIFTHPNSDTDGRVIRDLIESFTENNNDISISFQSMGRVNYLSSLQFIDGVVGNSSSGLAEAPSFKIGTINIGDRQKGRLKAKSIIDCEPTTDSIKNAIETLYSEDFQRMLLTVVNPMGEGDATEKIMAIIKNDSIPKELKKEFYDL
jgi:GDP/UDP-N,N'-diacetylbacillosamine 2-epimerase (hydrolysing)|tara:strand:+ start:1504 stop:2661 length:1158 start_codon:yes stop_codon:yes gene_type:complete